MKKDEEKEIEFSLETEANRDDYRLEEQVEDENYDSFVDTEVYEQESEYVLFDPRKITKGKTYMREYPELSRVIEFQSIRDKDLRFIWWYANPTSPLVLNYPNPHIRASKAYYKVYGRNHPDKKKKYCFCRITFPEGIKMAIEKMASFDIDARGRAKIMIDNIFKDYEEIINDVKKENFKNKDGDIDYNKFISVRKMIISEITDLIKIKEEGFGIKLKGKDKKEEDDGQGLISRFLKDKEDNI